VRDGIPVHRVDVRAWAIDVAARKLLRSLWPAASNLWRSWRLNRRLKALHRWQRIDVAQFSSYLDTAFFRPREIPSVVRLSSLQSLWDEAYERSSASTWRAMVTARLERMSLARADVLISPSCIIAERVERLTARSVQVVESPYVEFDGELHSRLFDEWLRGKRYALFFGTVGLLKGVRTLAEVMDPLLERYKELYFVFIGKQACYRGRPMFEYVAEQAGEHRGRVMHFDKMPHAMLYPFIEHAEAVVLPSRIDNFPNACLEAMALGKVVVGTRGASFEQLIEDAVSGFLCEIDDRKSLLAAIERALGLDDKAGMGRRAKARMDALRPELAGRRLAEVYEEARRRRGKAEKQYSSP
jgi:glycosyltransferase involved in cell wall biosynthesis